jgi:hypothetical protein
LNRSNAAVASAIATGSEVIPQVYAA